MEMEYGSEHREGRNEIFENSEEAARAGMYLQGYTESQRN
jgi:hypothetical protein